MEYIKITKKEANKIAEDNNEEVKKIKKDELIQLQSCMFKINNAAHKGLFNVDCSCNYKFIDAVVKKLVNDLGYEITFPEKPNKDPYDYNTTDSICIFKVYWN